jgi:hypothetical protein
MSEIWIDMDTVTPAHKYTPQDRKEIARQKRELTNALIKVLGINPNPKEEKE